MSLNSLLKEVNFISKEAMYNHFSSITAPGQYPTNLKKVNSSHYHPFEAKPTSTQKKLNSSVRRTSSERTSPTLFDKKCTLNVQNLSINSWKHSPLAIVKTVSLCYFNEPKQRTKRLQLYNKIKDLSSSLPQPQESIELYPGLDQINKFIRPNLITPQPAHLHELLTRNKNLIKVNEEFLNSVKEMQQQVNHHKILIEDLEQTLQSQRKTNQKLQTSLESMNLEQRNRQGKIQQLIHTNELLVREANKMKHQIKQNLNDIQVIRYELGSSQLQHISRDFSLFDPF